MLYDTSVLKVFTPSCVLASGVALTMRRYSPPDRSYYYTGISRFIRLLVGARTPFFCLWWLHPSFGWRSPWKRCMMLAYNVITPNDRSYYLAVWRFKHLMEWLSPPHKANQLARRYSHESAAKIRNKSEINKHYSNYLKNIPCLTTGDGKIIHFNKNLILWKHTKRCKNLKILCLTTENHKPLKI